MKLINPFSRKNKKESKTTSSGNTFIEVKYSKLDNIGKYTRLEIPNKEEIDTEINSFKTKIEELKNKLNNFNIAYGFCYHSFDFTDLVKPTLTPEYFILDWKPTISNPKTFEITDSSFTAYLKQNCKYIQKIYLSTVYFGTEHWNNAIHTSPILIHQKNLYIYDEKPDKLTFTYDSNSSSEPKAPLSRLLWQNQLACFTYQEGYPPDFNNKRIYFKVAVELIRVPINNNYLEENNGDV